MRHEHADQEWALRGLGKERAHPHAAPQPAERLPVGKHTLTEMLPAAIGSAPAKLDPGAIPGARPADPARLHRLFGRPAGADAAPAPALAAERPPTGTPLDAGTRTWMDRVFGHDFGAVRVHEGPEAGALGAVAFARGDDVHFAPGAYQPATGEGRELIAHELTHVVQQRRGGAGPVAQAKGAINADAGLEAEADRLGARAAAGERVEVHGVASAASGVQRHTHYPTRHGDPNPAPWAIPNGVVTQGIANAIHAELTQAGAAAMKQPKDSTGKRDESAPRTNGYVIAVVQLDTGVIYATCSGTPPPAFLRAVATAGATYLDVMTDQKAAKKIVKRDAQQQGQTGALEIRDTAGNCAAAKLILKIQDGNLGIPQQMSEILFSPNNTPTLTINDHRDRARRYTDGNIVPSCEHCQAILKHVLPGLASRVNDHRALQRRAAESSVAMAAQQQRNTALRAEEEAHEREDRQVILRAELIVAIAAHLESQLADRKRSSLEPEYFQYAGEVLDNGIDGWLDLDVIEDAHLADVASVAERVVFAAMEALNQEAYLRIVDERARFAEERAAHAEDNAAPQQTGKAKPANPKKNKSSGKRKDK